MKMKKFVMFVVTLVLSLSISIASFGAVRDDDSRAKYSWKETWASWEIFYPMPNLECIVVAIKDDPKYLKSNDSVPAIAVWCHRIIEG